eukprot:322312_1
MACDVNSEGEPLKTKNETDQNAIQQIKPSENNSKAKEYNDVTNTDSNDCNGAFSEPKNRIFAMSVTLIIYSFLSVWLFGYNAHNFSDANKHCTINDTVCNFIKLSYVGNVLLTVGIIGIAMGAIFAILFELINYQKLNCLIIVLLFEIVSTMIIFSGFFCVVVGMDDLFGNNTPNYIRGQFCAEFAEFAIVCSTGLVLGIDSYLYNSGYFNDDRRRALGMSGIIFGIFGLMAGICYAYISNQQFDKYDYAYDILVLQIGSHELATISCGYFILSIASIIRITTDCIYYTQKTDIKQKIDVLMLILLFCGSIICAVGYWSYIGFAYNSLSNEAICWYFGTSFFMLLMGIINAFDIGMAWGWLAFNFFGSTS